MGELVKDASTQYTDWKGTVAGDISDNFSIQESFGLLTGKERLVGLRLGRFESGEVKLTGYVADSLTVSNAIELGANRAEPLVVRSVEIGITPEIFIAAFKRFDLMMALQDRATHRGFQLLTEE